MKDNTSNNKENVTKYGEFVCSEYEWLPLSKQKEKAKELENVTNTKNRENQKNNEQNRDKTK